MTYLTLVTYLGIAFAAFLIVAVGCALRLSSDIDDREGL